MKVFSRRAIFGLALVAQAALAKPASVQRAEPELAVEGMWLVELRADVLPEDVAPLAAELVGRRGRVRAVWSSALRGFLVECPDSLAPLLAQHPRVERVVQDRRIPTPFSTPMSDCSQGVALSGPVPSLPQPIDCSDPDPQNASATCVDNWGLDRLDGLGMVRDGTYAPPRTGQGVNIFILDTGLYAQHQDFAGRVGTGYDATLSGSTDDCGSWSHGSHVAGIAAGKRFGVAKGATLHSVRVASCPVAIQLSYLVAGFNWIAQAHATSIPGPAVASMSINSTAADFTDPSSMLNTAITGVINAGVLVIESAGNNLGDACGHISRAPGVLIVGGSDEFDTPWERVPGDPNYAGWCTSGGDCGSNTGACISLFAPAAHIVSAWFGMTVDPRTMCRLSGTSMAAPHAAGAAALYLQAQPAATPAQLRQALIDRARPALTALSAGSPNKLLSVVEGQPGASVSAPSVDFGGVIVGRASTPPLSLTISSTGMLPLHVALVVSGPEATEFAVNGCTTPVAPAAQCTLSLVFSPSATGARTATLTLSTDDPARATIALSLSGIGLEPRLTVVLEGAGRVESAPAGISCGSSCASDFPPGTQVTLTASPSSGAAFSGWGDAGLCTTATCSVVLNDSTTVVATFSAVRPDAGTPTSPGTDAGTVAGTGGDGGVLRVEGVAGGCGCGEAEVSTLVLLALALLRPRRCH